MSQIIIRKVRVLPRFHDSYGRFANKIQKKRKKKKKERERERDTMMESNRFTLTVGLTMLYAFGARVWSTLPSENLI